ncbi:effector-associated domain 2-containing protein [Streptomyces tauricus]|uniref:VMAP-C domain-containing protein n=1 Tax=Streptomyces tauricus TaxID=68274 RepID=UPI00387EFAC1
MRGLELLAELTEALCELSCLDDAQTRVQFGALLGEHLHRRVEARGIRLRDDAALFARTALSVAGGEHVLLLVVRVYEGPMAATELERLFSPVARSVPDAMPSGPLSREDQRAARGRLDAAKGDVPSTRLRDELVTELNGLDLPMGLSVEQLFTLAVELNVQPDGLPPAVLLMDLAAALAASADHRTALARWAEEWAQQAGLSEELERRRVRRAAAAYDPEIPRCLVVSVEPARDGSEEVMVRSWLNTTPGRWNPQPGEPGTTRLDALGPTVERALRQGARLWTTQHDPPSGGREQAPPYVEFVLPYDLLNHDVAGLRFQIGDGRPLPLALKYAVHLRSLERMRTTDVRVRQQWQERWRGLGERGVVVHGWRESDVRRLDEWGTVLAGEGGHTAVVMDAPGSASPLAALKAAIAEGIGLALWDRRGVFLEERREVLTAVFASVPTPTQIPMAIHRLRLRAELNDNGPLLLGRHVAFFWDDPNRRVDFHDLDHDLPAGKETPT